MLNVMKMDLYRMFKTKSLWIIWLIMVLLIAATTYLGYTEYEAGQKTQEQKMEEEALTEENTEEVPNLGMDVTVPTPPGEEVTVFDMVYANLHGKFIALFIVIFAVIFSTADITSGYIKSIGGQVRYKSWLIVSKALLLFLYTALTIGIFILVQAVSNQIFFGHTVWGDGMAFLKFAGTEILLHYALALICMAIAVAVKNNVFSMIVSVLLCMNVMMILYGFADKMIAKMGIKDFNLIDYTVTGKIFMLPMDMTGKESISAAGISAVFIVVMVLLSSAVFEKRDI